MLKQPKLFNKTILYLYQLGGGGNGDQAIVQLGLQDESLIGVVSWGGGLEIWLGKCFFWVLGGGFGWFFLFSLLFCHGAFCMLCVYTALSYM